MAHGRRRAQWITEVKALPGASQRVTLFTFRGESIVYKRWQVVRYAARALTGSGDRFLLEEMIRRGFDEFCARSREPLKQATGTYFTREELGLIFAYIALAAPTRIGIPGPQQDPRSRGPAVITTETLDKGSLRTRVRTRP